MAVTKSGTQLQCFLLQVIHDKPYHAVFHLREMEEHVCIALPVSLFCVVCAGLFYFKKLCFHFRLLSCAHINDHVTGNRPAGNFSETINLYKLNAFESFTG